MRVSNVLAIIFQKNIIFFCLSLKYVDSSVSS